MRSCWRFKPSEKWTWRNFCADTTLNVYLAVTGFQSGPPCQLSVQEHFIVPSVDECLKRGHNHLLPDPHYVSFIINFSGFWRFRRLVPLKTCVGRKRTGLFWNITQRMVIIPYRRFGTTYWSHLKGPIGCFKSAVFIHFAAEAWNHACVGKSSFSVFFSTIISNPWYFAGRNVLYRMNRTI